jgi:exodeoxyribonuclease VII small subunit
MSPKKNAPPPASGDLSFEEALERLEGLVERLEEGEVPLEESVQAYAEGMRLVKRCMEKLQNAEATIRELHEGEEGLDLFPGVLPDSREDV